MDELLARHRKELRDLQSRITGKKKEATKKTRKAVNAECENLEAQTKARHAIEIQQLESGGVANGEVGISAVDANTNVYIPPPTLSDTEPEPEATATATETAAPPSVETAPPTSELSGRAKKHNRQKARLARRAAEIAEQSEAAALEANFLPNLRERELDTMTALFKKNGLTEYRIAPDGHCLYSAFAHNLRTAGVELDTAPRDYKEARIRCAEFMKENRADFEAFLEEDFEAHVRKVESTAEWGGQTEVMALGRAFGVKVNVLQAEGRGVESMNEDATGGEVWLGYYRHSFGLGEHYNSLVKEKA
ncbi:hypothetical protein BZA05DRAFT_385073 [Tricharina praecox]|uniref:uncharacterized protein n=1 Tax=Tricharina praecox TaxID=43433 RepID=UPI0022203E9B|nr:uncharacterized protein BZA05DRAFT_385073 [Tricharina praecox]KAI5857858.1 hypothetical protein BZA05DRAFT_385073 [Tricharina praecox]